MNCELLFFFLSAGNQQNAFKLCVQNFFHYLLFVIDSFQLFHQPVAFVYLAYNALIFNPDYSHEIKIQGNDDRYQQTNNTKDYDEKIIHAPFLIKSLQI